MADLPYGYVEDDAGVKDDGSGGAPSQLQERIDVVPGSDGTEQVEEEEAPEREEEEPFFVTHGDTEVRYSTF